jgi:predicted phage tail protein
MSANHDKNEIRPISLMAQAEALVETHLRARLQRARHELKLAKVDLLRDPANAERKTGLREIEKQVRELEVQVEVQVARVAEACAASSPQADADIGLAAAPAAPEAFRASQAAKAEQGMEFVRLQLVAETPRAIETTAMFSAAQVEKARATVEPAQPEEASPAPGALTEFLSADELAALRGT